MKTVTPTKFKETEIGLIPEEWDVKTVGSFATVQNGYAFKTTDFSTIGVPVVKIKNIHSDGITLGDISYISKELADIKSDYELKIGDILISLTGSNVNQMDSVVGKIGRVKIADKMLINQRVGRFVLCDAGLDYNYLYYYLIQDTVKYSLASSARGAANQANISSSQIESLPLVLPPLDEQRQITEVLHSLDDKIELNRKTNISLEKLADSLFKNWFIDIGDELPEGWEIKPLDKVANFLNGLALQKYPAESGGDYLPVIKIRELNNGIADATDKASTKIPIEYILKNGDIIFSWSGSLDVVIWCNGRGALNQHLFKVTSDQYPKWFYYQWTKSFLPSFQKTASDKAVTMGHIKRGHLTESMVMVPNDKTLSKMDELMTPIIETVINNSVEIRSLMDIRDSLLPRLMSGKIRVSTT